MDIDYSQGKEVLLSFYCRSPFSKLINKIHFTSKADTDQKAYINATVSKLLKGELSPSLIQKVLTESQKFSDQQIIIILSVLNTDVLDPLKEALDAVYNSSIAQNIATPQNQSIISKPVSTVYSAQQNLSAPLRPTSNQFIKSVYSVDPLDIFDRAKSDVRVGNQTKTENIQEKTIVIPEKQEPTELLGAAVTTETPNITNQNIKESVSINNNPIKINRAAILNDEENNNSLLLQDNQSITQLSKFTHITTPIAEKEDLNLYVPSTEIKEEPPKPLNPMSPDINTNADGDNNDSDNEITEGETPLENVSVSTPKIISLVDAQTVKPKETTIEENMSQSHLKFAQTSREEIPGNKSYSKLLNAMSPKIKSQPPIIGVLRNTFANPEKYTEPQEKPKPKPRKYTALGDNLRSSSIISSSEKSSNKESNAIMGKEIDNDIINLAKNISQEEHTPVTNVTNKPNGPIIYKKQVPKEEDPFSHINTDKLSTKEKYQNSNVIDLS